MKKLFIALICLLSFSFVTVKGVELPEVTDHEKVTIYLFRGEGCGHCYEALEYFNDIASDYSDYFTIQTYEVWNSSVNSQLLSAVGKEFGDTIDGVPYIVIGESYHQTGFASQIAEDIIEAALFEYENPDYVDVVADVLSKNDFKPEKTTLKQAAAVEGIISSNYGMTDEKEDHSKDAIIVVGIFAVLVGGIIALSALRQTKSSKK